MLSQMPLELSDFLDLVGESFIFSLEGVEPKVEGVLIKAEPFKSGSQPGAARDSFVLEFKFPTGTNIGQCTFQVKTANGDRFPPMLLVPRAADGEGWYMDATFN